MIDVLVLMESFNPHTHTGCDFLFNLRLFLILSFNPHTHTGCDVAYIHIAIDVEVSIHTPIQGVTSQLARITELYFVSIHTPIQGVTGVGEGSQASPVCFNPHTHTGCDSGSESLVGDKRSFNPHTHTGCDLLDLFSVKAFQGFNPHTHTGCDWKLRESSFWKSRFQSTHPYRV